MAEHARTAGGRGRRIATVAPTALGTVLVVAVSVRHAIVFFTGGVRVEFWPYQGHHRDMVLITVGMVTALAGLLTPAEPPRATRSPSRPAAVVALVVLTAALIVDVSKTATLGFVLPGMREEYGLSTQYAGLLPIAGLTGTVLGSLLWGALVDRLGVRRTLLLSTLGFIATSICGSMPTFTGNLVMCWLMGLAVGGLMPVVFSALTTLVSPSRVPAVGSLIAGVATAGGYLVASQSAALFVPAYGWRSLWLVGAFTGALVLLVLPLVPSTCDVAARSSSPEEAPSSLTGHQQHRRHAFYGFMAGLMALGVLTWVPTVLRSSGLTGGAGERLLAAQSWVSLPVAVILALVLRHSSPQRCARVLAAGAGSALVLFGLVILSGQQGWVLVLSLTATVLFSNAMVASVVPMSSVHYARRVQGRGLGQVAGASKLGGLTGPLALATLVTAPSGFFAVSVVVGSGTVLAGAVMSPRRSPTSGTVKPP
ncbi:putative MFS transporter [Saccharopolyspora lacisalsi]|uniref:Putative MFS transporter n=1 Tax=Halosaccharopolyspora lacisalsi TaxID=1000566 RepID=A0A839DXN3_9PSEU|nr:MFS transporter [Halosaccharopolyspora lacisalsi]MBA8824986.1 putative MFS transporter [Halosaccharopolyspora lacisalsi]